jgi:prepilin-type N-terminal cleavage/methylation domain-containing protein
MKQNSAIRRSLATAYSSRRGFTLIELLIIVGVIGILAVVVVILINPAELLKQSRDSNRLNGFSALNLAVSDYSATQRGSSLGTANTLYISIPDPVSTSTATNCSALGLPALPSGWVYQCAGSSTYKKLDGTGWIPLNLTTTPGAMTLGSLPIDPTNTTSSGYYYTYATDGTNYEITNIMESSKQRTALKATYPLSAYPGVNALGSSLTLSPLYSASGLLGYWKLDDGSSGATPTTANDSSGNNYNGMLTSGPTWTAGQVNNAVNFTKASSQYITMGDVNAMEGLGAMTISAWVNTTDQSTADENHVMDKDTCDGVLATSEWELWVGKAGGANNAGLPEFSVHTAGGTGSDYDLSGKKVNDGSWHLLTGTFDAVNTVQNLYVDGVLYNTTAISTSAVNTGTQVVDIGGYCNGNGNYFNGTIDDVRVYNRAYSAAEVMALYNAER